MRARAPAWQNVLSVKRKHQQALERIQAILPALGVARRVCTRQTAICLYGLLDTKRRNGLLAGKEALADGARIHDILQFARIELGIRVAENTRESYRKASLRPLNELGVITRHQLSTNDPNTFIGYRLYWLNHCAQWWVVGRLRMPLPNSAAKRSESLGLRATARLLSGSGLGKPSN